MRAGCYSLDLYCTNHWDKGVEATCKAPYATFPMNYSAQTRQQCERKARAAGWLLSKDRELCPYCHKGGVTEEPLRPGERIVSIEEIARGGS